MAQQMEAMRVAGVTARASNSCPEKISALWDRFWSENVMGTVKGSGMYAVYYEYECDHTGEYTLLIGQQIEDHAAVPHGMCEVTVQAGLYQQFDGPGEGDADVAAMWKQIWATPLDRAYKTDYEDYGSEGSCTIYVGVKAAPAPPAHAPSPVH